MLFSFLIEHTRESRFCKRKNKFKKNFAIEFLSKFQCDTYDDFEFVAFKNDHVIQRAMWRYFFNCSSKVLRKLYEKGLLLHFEFDLSKHKTIRVCYTLFL